MNSLEALGELQKNTVRHIATKPLPQKPKATYHLCKKPGDYKNQSCQVKHGREHSEGMKSSTGTNNSVASSSTTKTKTKNTKTRKLSTHSVRQVKKIHHFTSKLYFRANTMNRPHWKTSSNLRGCLAATNRGIHG